ncbi:hypothetical protein HU200_005062 [Digitaria exilis]|uniref:Uncharacterized protein n=1 Tax=Digitaria exilis TaxID=1010633 RepID=A0A835KWU6_9POAL|nr:hypothetical protein HU200_005062 [Digitaria exilis]
MAPELWRSVVMVRKIKSDALLAMAKVAVDRSSGQLEVFVGKVFVTDELLKHIGNSLILMGSDVTNGEVATILDGCPHLELLHLRGCFNIVVNDALRARCAGIKSLMLPRARTDGLIS